MFLFQLYSGEKNTIRRSYTSHLQLPEKPLSGATTAVGKLPTYGLLFSPAFQYWTQALGSAQRMNFSIDKMMQHKQ